MDAEKILENFLKKKEEKKIEPNKEKKVTSKKWHKVIMAIFLFFIFIPALGAFALEYSFRDKVFKGISIGEYDLGGKTKEELKLFLDKETAKIDHDGVTFFYQNKKTTVTPIVASTADPDLSRKLFSMGSEENLLRIYNMGRSRNLLKNITNQLKYFFLGQKVELFYEINGDEIEKVLKENFGYLEKATKNAEIEIVDIGNEKKINIKKEEEGKIFDYKTAIKSVFSGMAKLKNEPTELKIILEKPTILKENIGEETKLRAENLLKICSLVFGEGEKIWKVNKDVLNNWLELQPSVSSVEVGFNKEKVEEFLKILAGEINVKAQNAKFKVENGKVQEFQIHQGGKELNLEASYAVINNFILNLEEKKIGSLCDVAGNATAENKIQLIVDITAPQVPIASVNNLGIMEMVGLGQSDFSNSPVNRRHNIKTGAASLNGLIIAPGEEFSINNALGEINGQTGYLPEMVIKGNKTIPEFGGGLCQIATTAFRVALNAGLPITERQPHSYRVSYYEPAGTDATIYGPHPDLKFINDTPAYLLLQTKIEGNIATFELWGTSDGRKVEMTTPRVFNFVSPGPTKIVETEDLAPGVKKCTERAHTGADAEFTRTITPKVGEVKTEVWKSRYVPWSAVCLVGKALPTPAVPEIPQSTELIDPMLLQ